MLTLCRVCEACRFKIGEPVWNEQNMGLKATDVARAIGNGMTREEILLFVDKSMLLKQRVCSKKCARKARAEWAILTVEDFRTMSFEMEARR